MQANPSSFLEAFASKGRLRFLAKVVEKRGNPAEMHIAIGAFPLELTDWLTRSSLVIVLCCPILRLRRYLKWSSAIQKVSIVFIPFYTLSLQFDSFDFPVSGVSIDLYPGSQFPSTLLRAH